MQIRAGTSVLQDTKKQAFSPYFELISADARIASDMQIALREGNSYLIFPELFVDLKANVAFCVFNKKNIVTPEINLEK